MWRRKQYAQVNTLVHYVKYGSRDIFLYDVVSRKEIRKEVDKDIPIGCRTVGVKGNTVFMVGGYDAPSG